MVSENINRRSSPRADKGDCVVGQVADSKYFRRKANALEGRPKRINGLSKPWTLSVGERFLKDPVKKRLRDAERVFDGSLQMLEIHRGEGIVPTSDLIVLIIPGSLNIPCAIDLQPLLPTDLSGNTTLEPIRQVVKCLRCLYIVASELDAHFIRRVASGGP